MDTAMREMKITRCTKIRLDLFVLIRAFNTSTQTLKSMLPVSIFVGNIERKIYNHHNGLTC